MNYQYINLYTYIFIIVICLVRTIWVFSHVPFRHVNIETNGAIRASTCLLSHSPLIMYEQRLPSNALEYIYFIATAVSMNQSLITWFTTHNTSEQIILAQKCNQQQQWTKKELIIVFLHTFFFWFIVFHFAKRTATNIPTQIAAFWTQTKTCINRLKHALNMLMPYILIDQK